jgi:hypothetical protein
MNINLSKFLYSTTGKYLISILLGIGLATLFRSACKGKNCVVFEAPPLNEIENTIYKHDNKCYKYKPVAISCNKNKKSVPLYTF